MVELRPVDERNRAAVVALSVSEAQKDFVADNEFSLGQAELQPACVPLAIYAEQTPVGFLMYGIDPDDEEYWVFRLMVDKKYQGRGYGRMALADAVSRIREERPGRDIYISFEPNNAAAQRLYSSLGFCPDGWEIDEETVYRLSESDLTFRDITAEDYLAVAALSKQWEREDITWGFCADGPDYAAQNRGFVACNGAKIVGYLLGGMHKAKKMTSILPDGTPYFEIEELYVEPEWRNQGTGSRLMKRAQHVLQTEARALLLNTATKDYKKILDFYIRRQGMSFWSARLFKEL